jgi:hypothetical protein
VFGMNGSLFVIVCCRFSCASFHRQTVASYSLAMC